MNNLTAEILAGYEALARGHIAEIFIGTTAWSLQRQCGSAVHW